MHSPKFPIKVKDLQPIVDVNRLKLTWKNKVREAMRRQPVPDPLENLDFHIDLTAKCENLNNEIMSGSYVPRSIIRILAEKSKGLCRQMVIPSAKDALLLQALSDALWVEISKKAPSKNAFYAPQDNNFAKTIKGHSSDYGPVKAWLDFQTQILNFSKKKEFIVITDIANYYDTIEYNNLRNIVADFSVAREHAIDLLIYIISQMVWQPDYMTRIQVGLPQMNLDAPRLLAHCFLFDIDELVESAATLSYARFMDDIDVGVDSIAQAKRVVRDIDLALQTRQVRLNSGKTRILSKSEAERHFCVRENMFLDQLNASIESKLTSAKITLRESRFVRRAIGRGIRSGRFEKGNGEKLLKRCLNIQKSIRGELDDGDFAAVVTRWPAVRTNALDWWLSLANPAPKLPVLYKIIRSGELVDDMSLIAIANALVSARLPAMPHIKKTIDGIIHLLDDRRPWHFYAKLWIMSKYGSQKEVISCIDKNVRTWTSVEFLGRVVGGVYPRLFKTTDEARFENIILRHGSASSRDVLAFHQKLAKEVSGYTSIKNFVNAINPTMPNLITHSKFLMVMSILKNANVAPVATSGLRKTHGRALSDQFYKQLI